MPSKKSKKSHKSKSVKRESFGLKTKRALHRSLGDAHEVLDKYSKTGKRKISLDSLNGLKVPVEIAALHVVSQSARDTYELEWDPLSEAEPPDALAKPEVVVAGACTMRNDIGFSDDHPRCSDDHKTLPLRFVKKSPYCFTRVNYKADPPFNCKDWEEQRLALIDKCLSKSANIICLGEFDYPPPHKKFNQDAFDKKVLERIDAKNFPVFLVGGTRHEYDTEPHSCSNTARIYVNKELRTNSTENDNDRVLLHNKTVPAA